jgi:hypothetical protein
MELFKKKYKTSQVRQKKDLDQYYEKYKTETKKIEEQF